MGQQTKNYRLGVDILRCDGDLSTNAMIKMKGRLNRLVNKNHKKLLLDLSHATKVELAGVGILVDRLRHVRQKKGDIKLCNLRPEVEKTFRMIGVGSLMESYSNEDEAIRSFAA